MLIKNGKSIINDNNFTKLILNDDQKHFINISKVNLNVNDILLIKTSEILDFVDMFTELNCYVTKFVGSKQMVTKLISEISKYIQCDNYVQLN